MSKSQSFRSLPAKNVAEACRVTIKDILARRQKEKQNTITRYKKYRWFFWTYERTDDEALKEAAFLWAYKWEYLYETQMKICSDIEALASAIPGDEMIQVTAKDFHYFSNDYEEGETEKAPAVALTVINGGRHD